MPNLNYSELTDFEKLFVKQVRAVYTISSEWPATYENIKHLYSHMDWDKLTPYVEDYIKRPWLRF